MIVLTDKQIIERHDLAVRRRARTELAIVHRLIKDLTRRGYELVYDDGEEEHTNLSEQAGINVLFSVDCSHIYAKGHGRTSWVSLVMGNDGPDVISDYSMSLDDLITSIFEWINTQETAGRF